MAEEVAEEVVSIRDIVGRFIAAAPSGELQFVLSDLRGLVNADEFDLEAELPALVAEHNFDVHKAVMVNGLAVPLHVAGQLSDGYLFDPRSSQAFEYDHVVGVVRNTRALEDGEAPAATEQERSSAQAACQQYAEANLEGGAAGAYSTESGVSIGLSGFKDNLSNFWSGRWCSTWDCAISGSSADVSGSIKLLVHYFENGNVQFEVAKQVSGSISWAAPEHFGAAVVEFISAQEKDVSEGVNRNFQQAEESFKSLRRKLPKTKQEFNWQGLSKHSLARELTAHTPTKTN